MELAVMQKRLHNITGISDSRAEYMRVGMQVFIVCFAVSSQFVTYRLFENDLNMTSSSALRIWMGLLVLAAGRLILNRLRRMQTGKLGYRSLVLYFWMSTI